VTFTHYAVDAILRSVEQGKGDEADLTNIHCGLTLQNMVELGDSETHCLNLLDLPNVQPDVPMFLR